MESENLNETEKAPVGETQEQGVKKAKRPRMTAKKIEAEPVVEENKEQVAKRGRRPRIQKPMPEPVQLELNTTATVSSESVKEEVKTTSEVA